MTTENDPLRPIKVKIFNISNDVFETITDFFVDGLDLDGEEWERQYPSLNDLRDHAYRTKEALYDLLWPGWSFDEAEATGDIKAEVGRVSTPGDLGLRAFQLVIFAALSKASLYITDFFLEVAGETPWEEVDGALDDFRTLLLEQEEALFAELWPGRTFQDVVAAGDLMK